MGNGVLWEDLDVVVMVVVFAAASDGGAEAGLGYFFESDFAGSVFRLSELGHGSCW